MKILVTGSNGLLGQKLIYNILSKHEHQGIAMALGENRMTRQDGYVYESADITHIEDVYRVLRKHKPDAVILSAAMTNVDACETEQEKCIKTNVTSVQYFVDVLEQMRKEDASYDPHILYLSTDFVFDGEAGPYKETDEPHPLSFYADSKWQGEKIIMKSALRWSIARTIIIYGIVDGMSRSNLVLWVKQSLEQEKPINVVDDQFRSPTLAEDLAEGCMLIVEKGKTGVFHLSGPETASIYDLAVQIAEFWHLNEKLITPIKTASLGQPAKRPPRTGFILDKAREELGYEPHPFIEGLQILSNQLKAMQK